MQLNQLVTLRGILQGSNRSTLMGIRRLCTEVSSDPVQGWQRERGGRAKGLSSCSVGNRDICSLSRLNSGGREEAREGEHERDRGEKDGRLPAGSGVSGSGQARRRFLCLCNRHFWVD